ncbi:MAG: DUF1566 domain-containing protein [Pseudomonadota bacterium]
MAERTLQRTSARQKIGSECADGSIYVGMSPEGGHMYAIPPEATMLSDFNGAAKCAAGLNTEKKLGHNDWHVATDSELEVIFNNSAAAGRLNFPGRGFWTSTKDEGSTSYAKARANVRGENVGFFNYKDMKYRFLCVRVEPPAA